jgi:hypothetical protein
MRKMFFSLLAIILISTTQVYSQAASYFDPAQAYLKIMLDNPQSLTQFTRVGTYRVVGTPFLFAGKNTGDIYAKDQQASGANLSYNTFSQQLEIQQGNQTIIKDANEVDSFTLKVSTENFNGELEFVNAKLYNGPAKIFQRVLDGEKFILFKKYSSQLVKVSTNYVESLISASSISIMNIYILMLHSD